MMTAHSGLAGTQLTEGALTLSHSQSMDSVNTVPEDEVSIEARLRFITVYLSHGLFLQCSGCGSAREKWASIPCIFLNFILGVMTT